MGASSDSGASKSKRCQQFFVGVCIAAPVVILVVGFTLMFDSSNTPLYSATITAVSGLDPETDLRQQSRPGTGTLSPVFNLTVGVASHSRREGARIAPGTSVKVSYSHLRLPMASGHVPDARVGPRESRELPSVVARGREVAVLGFLMDSLAEEMRSGQGHVRGRAHRER
ncbi:unnamed protein product [Miscanthus lutarioriparius]|uniref:Uncharacterized protein n=1 Tax=Miscanthus lutarioriparius TaxID=422564 RepID=A0A811PP80_9POAL|nr:unnamed protein product [Miscanthus lutarioriparius]